MNQLEIRNTCLTPLSDESKYILKILSSHEGLKRLIESLQRVGAFDFFSQWNFKHFWILSFFWVPWQDIALFKGIHRDLLAVSHHFLKTWKGAFVYMQMDRSKWTGPNPLPWRNSQQSSNNSSILMLKNVLKYLLFFWKKTMIFFKIK